jgi:hypothetical protein
MTKKSHSLLSDTGLMICQVGVKLKIVKYNGSVALKFSMVKPNFSALLISKALELLLSILDQSEREASNVVKNHNVYQKVESTQDAGFNREVIGHGKRT